MANYNDINELKNIIKNNEYDIFINIIPRILDEDLANKLISYLCNLDNCNWLELAIPRFSIKIGKDIIQQHLSEIIRDEISIINLRKISCLLTKYDIKDKNEKVALINKMFEHFTEVRKSLTSEMNRVIPGDIVFYKIIAVLRNLKECNEDKVRFTLENICFIFSYQRELNFQVILKQMYQVLKYSEYY